MSFTYAIGDIHGRLDVLEACLDKLNKEKDAGTIVFLGDYIDRGPNSRGVIERLMEGSKDHHKWVVLLGNHELMAIMAHGDPENYWWWWAENGGLQTVMNYPAAPTIPAWAKVSKEVPALVRPHTAREVSIEHLQWMNLLPDRYEDKHRLFVHAGVKKDIPLPLQTQQMVIWVRHKRNEEVPLLGSSKYVVHGHTPFMDGPVVLDTRCNLDTGSYRTGAQHIAVFDDDEPGKPVQMLTVRAGYLGAQADDWTTW